jgi:hypothetical protein
MFRCLQISSLFQVTLPLVGYSEMTHLPPDKIILIGFFMVLFGFIVPFLTVLQVIPSNFILLFISYGASIGGLFFGFIGTALYIRDRRR